LESHASRVRKKLCVGAGDRFIVNVWGVGRGVARRAEIEDSADRVTTFRAAIQLVKLADMVSLTTRA